MASDLTTWRVGIVGVSSAGLFLFEQMKLSGGLQLIGAYDPVPDQIGLVSDSSCVRWDHPSAAITSPETDAVMFMGAFSFDLVSQAINNGKHVVIHEPWRLKHEVLLELARTARANGVVATVSCLRRDSADFVAALFAKGTGRLGDLQTVRFSSCETCVPMERTSTGMLREFGYHWLDQLLLLVDSVPCRVYANRFVLPDQQRDHGVWSTIEFANGCLTQIELESRSRLSHRTGWMLEGSTGGYRNDRLYTVASDGEIIDEPISRPGAVQSDSFIHQLQAAWQGTTTSLPSLVDAANVVRLIEAIEESAASGDVIRL